MEIRFNPSRGIAIIQTRILCRRYRLPYCFNPSRGIAIIQTEYGTSTSTRRVCFNPSRGIAIIQTVGAALDVELEVLVSIPHAG